MFYTLGTFVYMLHSQNPNAVDLFLVSETNTLYIFICAVKFNLRGAQCGMKAQRERAVINTCKLIDKLVISLLACRRCSSTSVSHLGQKEWSSAEPRRSNRHFEPPGRSGHNDSETAQWGYVML